MMMEKQTPCECPDTYVLGIEYGLLEPEHYDGISEWRCEKCGKRWGRWTKRELQPGEIEPRYGRTLVDARSPKGEDSRSEP